MPEIRTSLLAALTAAALFSTASPALSGECRDPWVTQAIREITGRAPNGSYESGECRYTNYGGGQWSSYADLRVKVQAVLGSRYSVAPAGVMYVRSLSDFQSAVSGGTRWYWISNKWYRIVSTGGGSADVISNDGSSLRLVASGGGNLVASGGGN